MKKTRLTLLCLLVCAVLLPALIGVASGKAETSAAGRTVQTTFTTFGHTLTWDFPYSDDFFTLPSDEYSHDFARLSLGLALAAFRDKNCPEQQDINLLALLDSMGFTDAETETYRTAPSGNSICFGLAGKRTGDATVIVCAVCGGNYGAEWASNLTVGNEVRSVGFGEASQKVQAALADYMNRHPAEGRVKLWITGFSRGAAVANLTAADCTASGRFDDVYAYTFATPLVTREPVAYPNIFNIIQKEDIVPRIPLEDWGFRRYGTDLFIVSPETDADCAPILNEAARLYREMTGAEMVFSSEINSHLRTLADYLLMLLPDSAAYTKYLQPVLIDIMTGDDGTKDALIVLMAALDRIPSNNPDMSWELKEMRDYLGTLISVYYLQGKTDELPPDQWDPKMGILNFFNAHSPFEYLALMYASGDPATLFSDNTDYVRLIIYGSADITVFDGDVVRKRISADGTEQTEDAAPHSFPEVQAADGKLMITFPADRSYTVNIVSKAALPQTVAYTGLRASGHTVRSRTDAMHSYLMHNGETLVVRTSANGRVIETEGGDHTDISILTETIYSPTTAMRMENNRVTHLTISGFINRVLLLLLILLIMGITAIVLAVIRKKKNRTRNAAAALVWYGVIVFLFALLEVAMWYFVPVLPLAKIIPGILAFIALLVYMIIGCRSVSRRWKAFCILLLLLIVHVLVESFFNGDFTLLKGILLMAADIAFLTAAFILLWRRKAEHAVPPAAD